MVCGRCLCWVNHGIHVNKRLPITDTKIPEINPKIRSFHCSRVFNAFNSLKCIPSCVRWKAIFNSPVLDRNTLYSTRPFLLRNLTASRTSDSVALTASTRERKVVFASLSNSELMEKKQDVSFAVLTVKLRIRLESLSSIIRTSFPAKLYHG